MLFQSWPTVHDVGSSLKQHWVNAPCLLGCATPPLLLAYKVKGILFMTSSRVTPLLIYGSPEGVMLHALRIVTTHLL